MRVAFGEGDYCIINKNNYLHIRYSVSGLYVFELNKSVLGILQIYINVEIPPLKDSMLGERAMDNIFC